MRYFKSKLAQAVCKKLWQKFVMSTLYLSKQGDLLISASRIEQLDDESRPALHTTYINMKSRQYEDLERWMNIESGRTYLRDYDDKTGQ